MADTWTAVIGRLGVPTSDGRVIMPAGFTTRPLPLPLSWQKMSDMGHDKSVVVGRIDTITPDPVTGEVRATGVWFDPDTIPEVSEARTLSANKVIGPSMDAAGCEVEYLYTGGGDGHFDDDGYHEPEPMGEVCVFTAYECAGATLVSVPAFTGVYLATDGSESLVASVRTEGWGSMPVAGADVEWDGSAAAQRVAEWAGVDSPDATEADWAKYARAFLYQDDEADPMTKGAYKLGVADVTDGELTLVPRGVYAVAGVLSGARGGADIPEAQQDRLKSAVRGLYERIASALDDDSIEAPFAALTASAAVLPPRAMFEDPGFTELTAPFISEPDANGFRRYAGHAAPWDFPHIGLPGNATCPKSRTGYAYYRVGCTLTDGGEVPTGKVTIGGGHADLNAGFIAASEHYDNVATTAALVTAGEDEFGIWFSGIIAPTASDDQVEALRQSPLSGDWRDIGGNLELVAVHAVNTPGFPVPRARAVVAAGGRCFSLVASAQHGVKPRAVPDKGYVERLASELAPLLRESLTADAAPVVVSEMRHGFDLNGDLRAQFDAAGIPWPAISVDIGGVSAPAFDVAPGCVRGMLAAMPETDQGAALALRRAQAKLRMLTEG